MFRSRPSGPWASLRRCLLIRSRRSASTQLLSTVTAATVATAALTLVVAAPARAESCPSEQQVLKSSAADKGYTCANEEYTGHRKLSPWATYVFLADASYQYAEVYSCSGRDNKNIDIIKAKIVDFQISFTATNWDISKSHHWWAGSLFAIYQSPGGAPDSDSYVRSCGNDDGKIPASFLGKTSIALTAPTSSATVGVPFTLTGTISPGSYGSIDGTKIGIFPVGSSTPIGQGVLSGNTFTATILPQVPISGWGLEAKYGGSSNTTPATSDVVYLNVAASAAASAVATAPPSVPRASTGPVVALTQRSIDASRFSLQCAPWSSPVLGTLMAERDLPSDALRYVDNGVDVRSDVRSGPMTLQLLCRDSQAGVSKGLFRAGTIRPDTFSTTAEESTLLGGGGGDSLTIRHRGGTAFGGVGGDTIIVKQRGAAVGGPGRDRLIARVSGAMLEGGPGRDHFRGSTGRTFINALDGQPGDRITCLSSRNEVLADKGDILSGPCTLRSS